MTASSVKPGEVVLLENCRFNVGEKADDEALSRKIAALCDVYVNDAFGTAHRAEATTHGVARFAKIACAGPLMAAELDALEQGARATRSVRWWRSSPARRSPPSSPILAALAKKVDRLIVGGGILNTFLLAKGYPIGKSLAEAGLVEEAKKIMAATDVPLPEDVVVAGEMSARARESVTDVRGVAADDMILDIGPKSAAVLAGLLKQAGTIVWNGPVGVFEIDAVRQGHRNDRARDRGVEGVLDRRRRRHHRRDPQVRRHRRHRLHLHRRRRVPRIPRGQDAAGRRGAGGARLARARRAR